MHGREAPSMPPWRRRNCIPPPIPFTVTCRRPTNISRTTVYANLTKLREDGSVICVGVVDGRERYDANTKPHPHFICDKCGKVLDVVGLPEPPSLDRQAEETNPIKVSYHELVFRGLCGECAGIK